MVYNVLMRNCKLMNDLYSVKSIKIENIVYKHYSQTLFTNISI